MIGNKDKKKTMRHEARLKQGQAKPPTPAVASAGVWKTFAPYIVVTVLILLVYAQSLSFGFTGFDDEILVKENYPVLTDLSAIGKVVRSDVFLGQATASFYRPVQMISYMFDAVIAGPRPEGHHISNVLLHIATVCALLSFFMLLGIGKGPALFFSAFFAVHPLFVQSVCWIPSRGDLLIGLFSVLSFTFFIKYLQDGKPGLLILHLATFTLAVFSKETALVLPFLLFVYALLFYRLQPHRKDLITTGSAWIVVLVLWYFLRSAVVTGIDPKVTGLTTFISGSPAILESISKLFLPIRLSPIPLFSSLSIVTGFIVILALTAWGAYAGKLKTPLFLFGLMWFFFFLVPGLFYRLPISEHASGYDYLTQRFYLPSVGLLLAIASFVPQKIFEKRNWIVYGCAGVVGLLGMQSAMLAHNYSNPMAFYTYAIASNPMSALAYNNRGCYRMEDRDLSGALEDLNEAVRIAGDYAYALSNRGNAYKKLGRYKEAIADCDASIRLSPGYANPYLYRGYAWLQLGNLAEAEKDLSKAVVLNPAFYDAYNNRGIVRNRRGDLSGALADFDKTLRLNPKFAAAYNNRGGVRWSSFDTLGAVSDFTKAIECDPAYADAFHNRGVIQAQRGKFREAVDDYSAAIRYNPTAARIFTHRGLAKIMLHDVVGAREDWTKALHLGDTGCGELLQRYEKK